VSTGPWSPLTRSLSETPRSTPSGLRGGDSISPGEIEEFLYQHLAIRDVQVIGVPVSKYGVELGACIIVRPGHGLTADDVQAFCRDQIAHYKIPRFV
jgi:fatty-acyl-CoA synthase